MLVVMGGLAGVMAGLLGIGGGALIVPVLVMVFERQGVNPAIIMQLALGTSLATIVFTAISSVLAHQKRGAVNWALFWQITPGIVVGTLLGSFVADALSSQALRWMFVVFMFAVAAQMSRGTMVTAAHAKLPGRTGVVWRTRQTGGGDVIGDWLADRTGRHSWLRHGGIRRGRPAAVEHRLRRSARIRGCGCR